MAHNLFGDRPHGTPRRPTNLRGDEGGSAHPDGNRAPVDDMDEDEWNDGGGPWQHARAPKRWTKDRSPQGTLQSGPQGRPNLGPTPLKIRKLPSTPHRARETDRPADADARDRQAPPTTSMGTGNVN